MARERCTTYPEVPRATLKSAPGIPGLPLPVKHADSVELQQDEDATAWFNRVFTMFAHRIDRLERKVARASRQTVAAALVPALIYLATALYAIAHGAQVLPVPPAKAAEP